MNHAVKDTELIVEFADDRIIFDKLCRHRIITGCQEVITALAILLQRFELGGEAVTEIGQITAGFCIA